MVSLKGIVAVAFFFGIVVGLVVIVDVVVVRYSRFIQERELDYST